MQDSQLYCVGAVDPGKVNPAAWVGLVNLQSNTIKTFWAAASTDITDLATEHRTSKNKKPTITDVGVEVGRMVLECCRGIRDPPLRGIVVETPTYCRFGNSTPKICGAATYGYLLGAGVENVIWSNSRTKQRAIEHFAESLGISGRLRVVEHEGQADRRTKEAMRKANKDNSVMVVDKLIEMSADAAGATHMNNCADRRKKDDAADAILLACGLALEMEEAKQKALTRSSRKRKAPPSSGSESGRKSPAKRSRQMKIDDCASSSSTKSTFSTSSSSAWSTESSSSLAVPVTEMMKKKGSSGEAFPVKNVGI